jgi:hypothetical protein
MTKPAPRPKHNPDNKRRADGTLLGGKAAQQRSKAYKASGKLPTRNMEVGRGSGNLAAKRMWGWLFGKDDDK